MKLPNPKIIHLVAQFSALYDGQPWYGDSLCLTLETITPAKAYWQPVDGAHSIAQITSHMIYWRQSLIKKLNGDLDSNPSMESEENWKTNELLKKAGWRSLLNSLAESQAQLLTLLAKQKDSILKKKYSEKGTFQDIIHGVLQHDLYHTGQLAYLKNIYHTKKN